MSIYKQPYLEKYHGRDSRHTCPSCKQKLTFTLYIDGNTGKPIHNTVGRCNRENKCGYHYTPKQYFLDNPERSENQSNIYRKQSVDCDNKTDNSTDKYSEPLNQFKNIADLSPETINQSAESPKTNIFDILREFDCIPRKYVINSASFDSNFVYFLRNYFPMEKIKKAAVDYALGTTQNKRVIFWQIDINGNVRTGKIMQYNPHTGRRVKNGKGCITWVHSILKKRNRGIIKFDLCQCYFGEHLLRLYPDKPVAIVEGEKTAVIGSMIYTDFIWLASGSQHGLTTPKSKVLKGRNVVLYPDAGCYQKWIGKMKRICSDVRCVMSVSELVEKHATDKELDDGYDIADYILDMLINT